MLKKLFFPLILIVAAEIVALVIAFIPDSSTTTEQSDSLKMTLIKGIPSTAIGTAGAIFFVVQYSIEAAKERAAKQKRHYEENIRSILYEWEHTAVYPQVYLGEIQSCAVPILINIIHGLSEHDSHHEVVSHLQTGYENEKIYILYQQLEKEEKEHNEKAILFNKELEAMRAKVQSITSLRLFDREERRTEYYNFESITRYLMESAAPEWDKNEPLRVQPYDEEYHKLRHRRIDNIAEGKESDLQVLRQYLESDHVLSMIRRIKEFNLNIAKLNETKKQLNVEVENIIHEADNWGIKGRCAFEDKLEEKNVRRS